MSTELATALTSLGYRAVGVAPTIAGASVTKIENTGSGGNATLTDTAQGFVLRAKTTGSGDNIVCAEVTPGATWTLTTKLQYAGPWKSFMSVGLYAKNNTSGKIQQSCWRANAATGGATDFSRQLWTTINTFLSVTSAANWAIQPSAPFWMRMQNDGTNLITSISLDGVTWITVESATLASHVVSADRCGIMLNNNQGTIGLPDCTATCLSWTLT